MVQNPHVISGIVYDDDGSTPLENIDVFVLNKTNQEIKHSTDSGFEDLKTNSYGEYNCNLADFDTDYNESDVLFITGRSVNKTSYSRVVVTTGSGGNDQNLTMETLDFAMNIVRFLRAWIIDPNTSRANTATMIMPNVPRSQKLTKASYPRISVIQDGEPTKKTGTSGQAKILFPQIKIGIHVWAKDGDAQKLTISGKEYEGQTLREKLNRDVCDKLDERFEIKPAYNRDPHIQTFYAYNREDSVPEDFNEEEGLMHQNVEFQFQNFRQYIN